MIMNQRSPISVTIRTKLRLKGSKLKLEKKLQKELTWDEFFKIARIEI